MSRAPDFKALVAQHGSPLLLLDCDVVRRQYQSLQAALPGVELFYALKPLPHPAVVAELRDLGGCFRRGDHRRDPAGQGRGRRRRPLHPHAPDQDRRGDPRRAALRHPHVRRRQPGRDAQVRPLPQPRRSCCCACRSAIRRRSSTCRASSAASRRRARRCSSSRASLGVTVRGFSFHVGSQVAEPKKYVEAIGVCAELIAQARAPGLARARPARHRRRLPDRLWRRRCADPRILPPDPRRR